MKGTSLEKMTTTVTKADRDDIRTTILKFRELRHIFIDAGIWKLTIYI